MNESTDSHGESTVPTSATSQSIHHCILLNRIDTVLHEPGLWCYHQSDIERQNNAASTLGHLCIQLLNQRGLFR
jgi:hypothetical protein